MSLGSFALTFCAAACAPSPRSSGFVFDDGAGGDTVEGVAGRGGNAGGGGLTPMPGQGGMAGTDIDSSRTDAGAAMDAASGLDAAAELDATGNLDAAPKLDATVKLDAAACSPSAPAEDIFADFEGGNVRPSGVGGRKPVSDSQLFDDNTSGTHTTMVVAGGRCATSNFYARYTGSGFTTWGSILTFHFLGNQAAFYDASHYKGMEFYARAASPLKLFIKFPDKNTSRHGGMCGNVCDRHWITEVMIGTTWKRYYVAFADLKAGTNVTAPALLTTLVSGVEFLVTKNVAFDLAIDDLSFVK